MYARFSVGSWVTHKAFGISLEVVGVRKIEYTTNTGTQTLFDYEVKYNNGGTGRTTFVRDDELN